MSAVVEFARCACGKPASHLSAPVESADWPCRLPDSPDPGERLAARVGGRCQGRMLGGESEQR